MKKMIVLDLDDTLLSTKKRHYILSSDIMEMLGYTMSIDIEDYLMIRKIKSNSDFFASSVNPSKKDLAIFNDSWLNLIENEEYLKHDYLLVSMQFFSILKETYDCELSIVSLRSSSKNAFNQVSELGLKEVFKEVFFLKHCEGSNPKVNILKSLKKKYNILFFCGDSNLDMNAAQLSGVNFVGVSTGIHPINCINPLVNINSLLSL